jgi:hypothetical protein
VSDLSLPVTLEAKLGLNPKPVCFIKYGGRILFEVAETVKGELALEYGMGEIPKFPEELEKAIRHMLAYCEVNSLRASAKIINERLAAAEAALKGVA